MNSGRRKKINGLRQIEKKRERVWEREREEERAEKTDNSRLVCMKTSCSIVYINAHGGALVFPLPFSAVFDSRRRNTFETYRL